MKIRSSRARCGFRCKKGMEITMTRAKELLVFLGLLVLLPLLLFAIPVILAEMLGGSPRFAGFAHYLRLFSEDEIFIKSLLITVGIAVLIGLGVAVLYTVVMALLQKKIKVSRTAYFIGSGVIGCVVCYVVRTLNDLKSGMPSIMYAQHTIVTHITEYFLAIRITNILSSLYMGVLIAFLCWISEWVIHAARIKKQQGNNKNENV